MRVKRILWFFMMIFLGLCAGLAYGWFINPNQYVEVAPSTLRADYKADFILMNAEIYHVDQDLDEAARRLSQLGNLPADQIAAEGLNTALEMTYPIEDLELMERLYQDLHNRASTNGAGGQP